MAFQNFSTKQAHHTSQNPFVFQPLPTGGGGSGFNNFQSGEAYKPGGGFYGGSFKAPTITAPRLGSPNFTPTSGGRSDASNGFLQQLIGITGRSPQGYSQGDLNSLISDAQTRFAAQGDQDVASAARLTGGPNNAAFALLSQGARGAQQARTHGAARDIRLANINELTRQREVQAQQIAQALGLTQSYDLQSRGITSQENQFGANLEFQGSQNDAQRAMQAALANASNSLQAQGMGENAAEFAAGFNQRENQYGQDFNENQRRYNNDFGENRRRYDDSKEMDWIRTLLPLLQGGGSGQGGGGFPSQLIGLLPPELLHKLFPLYGGGGGMTTRSGGGMAGNELALVNEEGPEARFGRRGDVEIMRPSSPHIRSLESGDFILPAAETAEMFHVKPYANGGMVMPGMPGWASQYQDDYWKQLLTNAQGTADDFNAMMGGGVRGGGRYGDRSFVRPMRTASEFLPPGVGQDITYAHTKFAAPGGVDGSLQTGYEPTLPQFKPDIQAFQRKLYQESVDAPSRGQGPSEDFIRIARNFGIPGFAGGGMVSAPTFYGDPKTSGLSEDQIRMLISAAGNEDQSNSYEPPSGSGYFNMRGPDSSIESSGILFPDNKPPQPMDWEQERARNNQYPNAGRSARIKAHDSTVQENYLTGRTAGRPMTIEDKIQARERLEGMKASIPQEQYNALLGELGFPPGSAPDAKKPGMLSSLGASVDWRGLLEKAATPFAAVGPVPFFPQMAQYAKQKLQGLPMEGLMGAIGDFFSTPDNIAIGTNEPMWDATPTPSPMQGMRIEQPKPSMPERRKKGNQWWEKRSDGKWYKLGASAN